MEQTVKHRIMDCESKAVGANAYRVSTTRMLSRNMPKKKWVSRMGRPAQTPDAEHLDERFANQGPTLCLADV
jgi:predicted RNA polymerase sigma factor